MSGRRRMLFVHGLEPGTRAKEVAYEFERYGRVNRVDIPVQSSSNRSLFAFVEYDDGRDAEDAYYELHGKRFLGGTLRIEWSKKMPRDYRDDRKEGGKRSPPRHSRGRSRSPEQSYVDGRNDHSPVARSSGGRSRSPAHSSRSRSPILDAEPKRRSPSPYRSPPYKAHESDSQSAVAAKQEKFNEDIDGQIDYEEEDVDIVATDDVTNNANQDDSKQEKEQPRAEKSEIVTKDQEEEKETLVASKETLDENINEADNDQSDPEQANGQEEDQEPSSPPRSPSKRKVTCSLCHQPGHNKTKCPNK